MTQKLDRCVLHVLVTWAFANANFSLSPFFLIKLNESKLHLEI